MSDNALSKTTDDFLLAEYNTLRTELLQLFSTRYQIIALAFSAFSAVLAVQAFGAGSAGGVYLVLLYPVLAFFLLNIYISNSRRINRIEKYIKDTIETYVQSTSDLPFGWQGYYDRHFGEVGMQIRPPFTFGGRFIFPATAVVTLIAAFQGVKSDLLPFKFTLLSILYAASIVFFFLSIVLAIWELANSHAEYGSQLDGDPKSTATAAS